MLGVVLEHGACQVEHLDDAAVGDPVVDDPVLPAGGDEAAPAQTREMVGDLRLGEPEAVGKLADRELVLLAQQLEDAKPSRVAEAPEVLRDEVVPDRGFGESEWSKLRQCTSFL